MLSRRAGGPFQVQVPGQDEDRPQWKRVAIIAAVGFLVGIAWPRLAGVRMGPSLPEASSAAVTSSAPVGQAPVAVSQAAGLPAAALVTTASAIVGAQHPSLPPPPPAQSLAVPSRSIVTKTSDATTDGPALVVWEVAIIRDAPKTGKVVARLQRGSALRVGPVKDGWYPVRYGDDFSGDGWVYRGAIGR